MHVFTARRKWAPLICVLASAPGALFAQSAAAATPEVGDGDSVPDRTSISFHNSATGFHAGTANEHESRPGLSIVKLYIADYVLAHGNEEEKLKALHMLRVSDDGIADELYAAHPESITATAQAYGLADTHDDGNYWGTAATSTYDAARFLEERKNAHGVGDPLLQALATAAPVAADGYGQDFGTSELPGVIGTKWGWSNDHSLHASASFGQDFTVAAHTNGGKEQLTDDVRAAFNGGADDGATGQIDGIDGIEGLADALRGSL